MRKIRILGIAPYEGVKILMDEIASQNEDMQIDTYVGDMENGLAIAQKYYTEYDIIVSRGGTADLIRQANLLPVVNIRISVYDIFRSIQLAMSSQKKIVLIGFPSLTENASFLKEMLQLDLPIYTVHNMEECRKLIHSIKMDSYDLIITGANTSMLAAQCNIPSILINSGVESITDAFNLAKQIAEQRLTLHTQKTLFQNIIENASYSTVVFTSEKDIYYQSMLIPLPEQIQNVLINNLPSCFETDSQKIYFEYCGLIYSIISKQIHTSEQKLVAYYINTRRVPLGLRKNGVRYTSFSQSEIDYKSSFSGITNINTISLDMVKKYSESNLPIAVIGDAGSGKTAVVNYLYLHGTRSHSPMAIIDCSKVREKMWDFVTNNENSPLSDTNTSIFFKNLDCLSMEQFQELIELIDDLKLYRRNTLYFTIHSEQGQIDSRFQSLLNQLHCLTVTTSSLNNNLQNLPEMVSLYLNYLNITYGKNIVGIEPEGLSSLQTFDWSKNYDQLMRILNQLAIPATSLFIDSASVRQALKKEALAVGSSKASEQTHFENMTLEEINLQIIHQEIARAGGNQTKAAEKLGISRTTLWRMLQKSN